MAAFHETRIGVRFFEVQLPALTKALEHVADAVVERSSRPSECDGCRGDLKELVEALGESCGSWEEAMAAVRDLRIKVAFNREDG